MKIITDMFRSTRAPYSLPDSQQLHVGAIPDRYNRSYAVRSTRHVGMTYQVNPARLSCTCSGFRKSRDSFAHDDVRRVCRHIYAKLRELKIERDFDPLIRLVLRYGRAYRRFHALENEQGNFIFAFSSRTAAIKVFALIGSEGVFATYDLDTDEWFHGSAPNHALLLKDLVQLVFCTEAEYRN